jgi:hypothetical protein
MNSLYNLVTVFAAAGGGGSSSGGGGGGAETLFGALGYFPSYWLGKLTKKFLPRTAELIVSAAVAIAASIVILALGFGGGFFGAYITICVVIGIWAGWGSAFFGIWDRLSKRNKQAKSAIALASQTDSTWNEEALTQFAVQTFLQYQYDWSTFNTENMKTYLAPHYHQHASLMLRILQELGRSNVMANITITHSLIVDVHDDADNANDTFTVAFEARATDQLVGADGTVLFTNKKPFIEYWRFVRGDNTWLLHDITQQTQELAAANASIQTFAHANNMYYSLDMGWLFLPNRGVLISRGKMGQADINNHVVGTYNNHLVQLYTYTPVPAGANASASWMMLQITLPKSYGGILVQQKRRAFSGNNKNFIALKAPKGYQRHTFEWPDFNKRYTVHATDADRLATFELINPGFMAYLYDNDPSIGIEVADNTLYLFKYLGARTTTTVNAAEYTTMLTIALKAFKELQL